MDHPTSWDSLCKQARRLEAQLDEQMHLYRKFVSRKVDDFSNNDFVAGTDQLLKQLQLMQAWVSYGGSELYSHKLTRHQEILRDLTQVKNSIDTILVTGACQDFREFDRTRLEFEEGDGSYEQDFLKEPASVTRSTGQTLQAQETFKTLVLQRSTFRGINSKLCNVNRRLPTVNQIMARIKKKKSMDTIIVSLVASVCTFLIIIYWWTN